MKLDLNLKELINKTCKGLRDLSLKSFFPFIEENNIFEKGSLHSLVLTSLTLLGFKLKFSTINEKNIYNKNNANICRRKGKTIRPDCIWFNSNNGNPDVLFEFEQLDLKSKIENLIIMEDDLAGGNSTIHVSKLFVLIYPKEKYPNFDYDMVLNIIKKQKLKINIEKSATEKIIQYKIKNIPLLLMKLDMKKNNAEFIQDIRINFDRLFWNKKQYDFKSFKKIFLD